MSWRIDWRRIAATAWMGAAVGLSAPWAAPVALAATPPGAQAMIGTFRLGPVSCPDGRPSGSYLSVTYGTRSVVNTRSSCGHGAYTLLPAGRVGLSTQRYTPARDAAFGRHGDADADPISRAVDFNGHDLALITSSRDLQDAPTGAPVFARPTVYLVGDKLVADLRALQVLYKGPAGATCVTAAGRGCWLIGAERATGTYDPTTHHFTLDWFSGQSFAKASAGTVVHLAGRFIGAPRAVPEGHTVELGTQSFAAGSPPPVPSGPPAGRRHGAAGGRDGSAQHSSRASGGQPTAAAASAQPRRSSLMFAVAEGLVAVNLMALIAAIRRRWST